MTDPWYVVLRDLLIILAALATVLAASFGTLVAWRLYRLALTMRGEIEPILASLNETAATVRDSSTFVRQSRMPSPMTTVGMLTGGLRLVRMVRQLRKAGGVDEGDAASAGPAATGSRDNAAAAPQVGGSE